MTIKLGNIADWSLWSPGRALALNSNKLRKVRLEVNCTSPTAFHVRQDVEVAFFLGVVHGREIIEFAIDGDCSVMATSDDDVWFYTSELDETWMEVPDSATFTKLANRRTRNPELELIQFKMEQNMRQRFSAMEAEFTSRFGHNPTTGEVVDDANGDAAADDNPGGPAPAAVGVAEPEAPGGDAPGAVPKPNGGSGDGPSQRA